MVIVEISDDRRHRGDSDTCSIKNDRVSVLKVNAQETVGSIQFDVEQVNVLSAKIGGKLPKELHHLLDESRVTAKLPYKAPKLKVDLGLLRRAVAEEQRLEIDYVAANGKRTQRVVNPLELRLYPPWVLIAWCEKRDNVRMFRVERMKAARVESKR